MGASIWWPGGRGTKAAMTIYPDGNVEVRCGTQDIGTGTRTYVASIAAEELGIDMSKIRPLIGDSDYPRSGASGAAPPRLRWRRRSKTPRKMPAGN